MRDKDLKNDEEPQNVENLILETLKEPYEKDETVWVLSSELAEKTNISDYDQLKTIVEILYEKGLVDIPVRAVKEFAVRLTKKGLSYIQKNTKLNDDCKCSCHLGGAVSCPDCRKNHEKNHNCCHCD